MHIWGELTWDRRVLRGRNFEFRVYTAGIYSNNRKMLKRPSIHFELLEVSNYRESSVFTRLIQNKFELLFFWYFNVYHVSLFCFYDIFEYIFD